MAVNCITEKLISIINTHLDLTEEQITRLKQIFLVIAENTLAKKSETIKGLIKEGEDIPDKLKIEAVRDAMEIAICGTLIAFAKTLGGDEATDILKQILADEKETDR